MARIEIQDIHTPKLLNLSYNCKLVQYNCSRDKLFNTQELMLVQQRIYLL